MHAWWILTAAKKDVWNPTRIITECVCHFQLTRIFIWLHEGIFIQIIKVISVLLVY